MLYNKDYFVKGIVDGVLRVSETNYHGEVVGIRSFIGEPEGEYVLTIAWSGGRESKTFGTFAEALAVANGYWGRQAIWHKTPEGRRRVIRWQ